MKFNICVAIPIKTGLHEENKEIIEKALESKPDFIELRFDYIDDIQEISRDFVNRITELIQPHVPVIFTFRHPAEGGQYDISEGERLRILTLLIEAKPDFIDIEMNADKHLIGELVNLAIQGNVRMIFSYHDFEKTLSHEEGCKIINEFEDRLTRDFSINVKDEEQCIYKIIFSAQKFEDNLIPLKMCDHFSHKNKKIISFCMGELGIFSRITCVKVGSFLTFGSLTEKTAKGQLNVKEVREIQELLFPEL